MNSFTSITNYTEAYAKNTSGYEDQVSKVWIIEADPKRSGLYVMAEYQTSLLTGQNKRFNHLYGKSNQSKIIEQSKSMIEFMPL